MLGIASLKWVFLAFSHFGHIGGVKTKIALSLLVAVSMFCVSTPSPADGIPDDAKEYLGKLVGKWEVETQIGGKTFHTHGYGKWAPDEVCLIWHFSGEDIQTGGDQSSSGMIGWDSKRKKLIERGFSSNGESFFATWELKADRKCVSSVESVTLTAEGKFVDATSQRNIVWKSDDVIEFGVIKRVVDGEEQPDAISIFRRVK